MEPTPNPQVLSERRADALWITLNRPDAMNAITPALIGGIAQALDLAQVCDDVRAVVLTGAGRAFCCGVDLKSVPLPVPPGADEPAALRGDARSDAFQRFLEDLGMLLTRLERFPKPVLAAVNGLALAGGLELVLCCDIVLAARSARFGDAHAKFGLLPGGGGSVRLPRKIGVNRALHMMFSGAHESAASMQLAGLVNEVVDAAQLEAAVQDLVTVLARKSPLGLRRMKALVHEGLEQPAAAALRQELLVSAMHAHSHDMREGLAAFQQGKREPRFTGC